MSVVAFTQNPATHYERKTHSLNGLDLPQRLRQRLAEIISSDEAHRGNNDRRRVLTPHPDRKTGAAPCRNGPAYGLHDRQVVQNRIERCREKIRSPTRPLHRGCQTRCDDSSVAVQNHQFSYNEGGPPVSRFKHDRNHTMNKPTRARARSDGHVPAEINSRHRRKKRMGGLAAEYDICETPSQLGQNACAGIYDDLGPNVNAPQEFQPDINLHASKNSTAW